MRERCIENCLERICICLEKIDFNDETIIYPIRVIAKQGTDKHRNYLNNFFSTKNKLFRKEPRNKVHGWSLIKETYETN